MNTEEFVAQSTFKWHQYFELTPGVHAPGKSHVPFMYRSCDVPADLTGLSVLDIGTTNGGAAFTAERHGASRVLALDIVDDETYGFRAIRDFLGSNVEFVQTDILDYTTDETFDIIFCWGVLYHLRDPLGGIEQVRKLARDIVCWESAVCNWELPADSQTLPVVRYYRDDELSDDPTNWFSPTIVCLREWLESGGFKIGRTVTWPGRQLPGRALMTTRVMPGEPEWAQFTPVHYPTPYR